MSARHDRPLPVELAVLADQLIDAADRPVPTPDPAFVDDLEARLRTLHRSGEAGRSRRPVARRLLPVGGVTIAVSALLVVGAAAAGIVATRALIQRSDRPDRPEHSVPAVPPSTAGVEPSAHSIEPATTDATTEATAPLPGSSRPDVTEPTATTAVTTVPAPGNAPADEPAATVPDAVPVVPTPTTAVAVTSGPPATTAAPTSAPATTTPPLATATPPTTTETPPTAAPTTTEVHTAAVMALTCASVPGGVSCSWTPGPAGTVSYLLLRGQSSGGTGSVLTPAPGATSMVDTTGTPGTTYLFVVQAVDASGTFIGHSDLASATVGP